MATINLTNNADYFTDTGSGNVINGLNGDDVITAGDGDTVHGGEGVDALFAGAQVVAFYGDGGNDSFYIGFNVGVAGVDVLDGGAGQNFAQVFLSGTTADLTFALDMTPGSTSTIFGQGTTLTNIQTVSIFAGSGDDHLTGGSQSDYLTGGEGDDILDGGGARDLLSGDGGHNTVNGGEGDDEITSGPGVDVIDGGSGADLVRFQLGAATADLTFALDDTPGAVSTVIGQGATVVNVETMVFQAGSGDDTLSGAAGDDVIYGGGGDNLIDGGGGRDSLSALGGDDIFHGGAGGDRITGGLGMDTSDYHDSPEGVVIKLSKGAAQGSGGDATGDTLGGIENLIGSDLADKLTGDAGANVLTGRGGADVLTGGAGDDHLDGGAGADTLNGGTGADAMAGGDGDDRYTVDDAGDTVAEVPGEGVDKVTASISYTLGANVEALKLSGSAAIDGTGNDLDNTLSGNNGDNLLAGGAGADKLNGQDGADTLIGGAGKDTLIGGAGADTFVFGPALAADADKINDFAHGLDHLAFHAGDYGLTTGALDPANLVIGPAATDGHAEFVYDMAHKALYWDADGTGAGARILVTTFATGVTLSADDFTILG